MRITITTEMGKRAFAGTVIGGAARIVEVKGMELDAAFAPAMLYVNNLDKPGFIGALGALLGQANLNIATFNLGLVVLMPIIGHATWHAYRDLIEPLPPR